jgi:uncharacterized protein (DUF362 family)
MKNLMGITGGSRNRFHQDISKTLVDIAGFIKPQLVVLDALRVLTANGPTGGNLADGKRKDMVVAGIDQVAVDAFGATILGLSRPRSARLWKATAAGSAPWTTNHSRPCEWSCK